MVYLVFMACLTVKCRVLQVSFFCRVPEHSASYRIESLQCTGHSVTVAVLGTRYPAGWGFGLMAVYRVDCLEKCRNVRIA